MTNEQQKQQCEKTFLSKAQYYRATLSGFLIALAILAGGLAALIVGSYNVGKELSDLNSQIRHINYRICEIDKKLDKAISIPSVVSVNKNLNFEKAY
jgi:cell division protein FtsL